MNVAGLDLNLLLTLQALLQKRNVTRAGEQVRLSQPATSAALARLRRHFNDELLVRSGRGYQLTPLARVLLPLVADAVVHVERAFDLRPTFDAAGSERRFTVASSDYTAAVLMRPMRELLQIEAPGAAVEFLPMPQRLGVDQLLDYDLLVGPRGFGLTAAHDLLFEDRFVLIADANNPALAETTEVLTLLAVLPHAVGRFSDATTPADRLLEELGVQRHMAAAVEGLVPLPLLVLDTDLIALVPWRLARRFATNGIAVMEVPGSERAMLAEAAYWHPSRTTDPGTQWLRTMLIRSSQELER